MWPLALAGVVVLAVAVVGGLAFAGVLPWTSHTDPEIIAVLQRNVDATNNADAAAYMSCLDPSSPLYRPTQSAMETLFATYRIHVELNEASVIDATATVAHVHVVMTTTKISGPDFKNNRLTAIMELHKVNGAWKIFSQTITNVEYL